MRRGIFLLSSFLIAASFTVPGTLWAETTKTVEAGIAADVKGEVKAATPPEKMMRPLKNGDKIFMGDKIETGADGQLQVLLLDQTVFTLGPLSGITIDEFIYDPGKAGGNAGVVKGVFRAVAGKVASKPQQDSTEVEAFLDEMDDMNQKSDEASQDREQSSVQDRPR